MLVLFDVFNICMYRVYRVLFNNFDFVFFNEAATNFPNNQIYFYIYGIFIYMCLYNLLYKIIRHTHTHIAHCANKIIT